MTINSPESPQLDYAPAPPKRRKWLWRTLALILGICVGLASVRWGPQFVRTAKVLYWQRQCLNYSAPADRVVYEEDPDAAEKLMTSGSREYFPIPLHRVSDKPTTAASFEPSCWLALRPRVTMFPAMLYAPPSSPLTPPVLFLHELTSAGGSRRLVCVRYVPQPQNTFAAVFVAGFDYDSDVLIPATWTMPAARVARGTAFSVMSGIPRHPPNVRFYAGQPDPADPSHFTIRYEMWGQSDVLDGYLGNDDGIILKPRKLPEDRRSPPLQTSPSP
jgi:hypothetical protein